MPYVWSGIDDYVPTPTPPPVCLHGMVRGESFTGGPFGGDTRACAQCNDLVPHRRAPECASWNARHSGLGEYLQENEPTCADADLDTRADRLARSSLRRYLGRENDYNELPSETVGWRRWMKAYIIDRLEPGRVEQLLLKVGEPERRFADSATATIHTDGTMTIQRDEQKAIP